MTPIAKAAVLGMPIVFTARRRVTGPNEREHFFARKRRVAMERNCVAGALLIRFGPDWRRGLSPPPYVVTLTRLGKRLLDDDNLQGACKAVRDEVARQLGLGDSPRDPITWRYGQRVGDVYGVEIKIEAAS